MTLHGMTLGGLLAAAFALAGCGSGQASSGIPTRGLNAQARAHLTSTSSGSLAYVVMNDKTFILTYPGLKEVATIKGGYGYYAISDPNNGNVMMGDFEFAHGSTKPFAKLSLGSELTYHGDSFDPTTDDIAFSVDNDISDKGYIAVYKDLYGSSTIYTDPDISYYKALAYDGQGNLFVWGNGTSGGSLFAELPKGASQFTNFARNQELDVADNMFWDGTYIVVRAGSALFRVTFSGSTMTVVGKTKLGGAYGAWWHTFDIQGGSAIGPHLGDPPHNGRYLGLWHYPQGGPAYKVVKSLSKNQKERVDAVAVSVAPKT